VPETAVNVLVAQLVGQTIYIKFHTG